MRDVFRGQVGQAPPAPRELTPDMSTDAHQRGRFLRLFGAIFFGVGMLTILSTAFLIRNAAMLWQLLFPVSGAVLWLIGAMQKRSALGVFREGAEANGKVVRVFLDYRVRMNKVHPWRVEYEFSTGDGSKHTGIVSFWDNKRPEATEGENVVVLYDPDRPSRNVLWSRFIARDPRPGEVEAAARAAGAARRLRVDARDVDAEAAETEAAAVEEAAPEERRDRVL